MNRPEGARVVTESLARLTGWDLDEMRTKIPFFDRYEPEPEPASWWRRLWR